VQNANGETVSVIVPVYLWRQIEALLLENSNKDFATVTVATKVRPRFRDRPLTEKKLREKVESDRMADANGYALRAGNGGYSR
jgi:hypothetical protein